MLRLLSLRSAGAVILLAALSVAGAQGTATTTPSAGALLRRALDLSQAVNDYTAAVHLSADIEGAPEDMPDFKVYFKRPDKVHIESRSIVIVRKDMLTFGNLAKRVEEGAQVVLAGTKNVGGTPMYVVKLIPKVPENPSPPPGGYHRRHGFTPPAPPAGPPRVLVTINGRRWTIERMDLYDGDKLAATMYWTYVLVKDRYWMPSRIQCTMPSAQNRSGRPGAQLVVTFSNYTVNTGLSDSLFVQPPRPSK